MRSDSIRFANANTLASREPRFVVRIEFPTASVHCSSHDDIPNIPGIVVDSVLQQPSAISQALYPDEGRSEIGSFNFTLADVEGAFTDAIKNHLADDEGLRGREVQFYVGFKGFDFTEFQRFTTQIVVSDTVKDGVYTVQCRDITRAQNAEIFKPVATTLRQSVDAAATTIPVGDTTEFEFVAHGSSYSDAPNQSVGYFRLDDEIIRWTGKTSNSFTGCTRGVLNTVAKPHAISDNTSQDRQPKVEEFIYLELPGPKLAYAILTGIIYGTVNTLPAHWNLGIDPSYVRVSNFVYIGPDLWNPGSDTDALVLRFEGLKAQDGKRFVEKEIYLLLGCFSPVYSDGTLGLRRMSPLVSSASPTVTLTENEITALGSLEHDGESMHNQFRILWAYDALVGDFIRESRYIDAYSEGVHGASPLLTYEFRGLHGERHTDTTIAQRLASIRDRYSTPPERLTVSVFGSLSRIEIGDVVRIKLNEETLRDYYQIDAGDFNRSFEVYQQTYDATTGEVTLELFGSTYRPVAQPPVSSDFRALPDSWYSGAGASLSTVLTISSNVVQAGSYEINGTTDLNDAASIFYWDDDLTIADGAVITITGNVQLRVRGFLTINGDIDGTGGGLAGVSDSGGPAPIAGNPGYLGNSRGWDGIQWTFEAHGKGRIQTSAPAFTRGSVDAVPTYELSTTGGVLSGLPSDLRGGGGAPGGRLVRANGDTTLGGAGAAGGAGLAIVCRGLSFGASGSIVLDGVDSGASSSIFYNGVLHYFAGSGGGGAPGALLILLDGSGISFPLIAGKFFARGGVVLQQGKPMFEREMIATDNRYSEGDNIIGYADPDAVTLSGHDYSTSAYGIQYLAEPVDAEQDINPNPPPPSGLRASSVAGGNQLTWTAPDADLYTVIEIYGSVDNNRTNAIFLGEIKGSTFFNSRPLGGGLYYWIRSARTYANGRTPSRSAWEPLSEIAGVFSSSDTPGDAPDAPSDFFATGQVNGIRFTWSLPGVGRFLGRVKLFQNSAPSPFEDAALIWEGYSTNYTLARTDLDTKYYWVQLYRGNTLSATEPFADGLAAAPTAITAALGAISSVPSVTVNVDLSFPNPKTVITPTVSISASGGVPGYTYSWEIIESRTSVVLTIDSPSSASTKFRCLIAINGDGVLSIARCTVTDSLGFTAFADVTIKIIPPRPVM